MNGIVFLVSLSDSPLLVYKNAIDYWIFALYPATLLNLFVSSSSFLVESLGLSIYSTTSSTNDDSLAFFSPVWVPFISSCLIVVARTSSTVLNRSGESCHPCFVTDLSGKALGFCPLSMMLAVWLLLC